MAALGPLGTGVHTASRLRIARPEDNLLSVLQAILDRAIKAWDAQPHVVAIVMHRSPIPAFPADGARVDPRVANEIAETLHRAQVIVDVSPLMMRRRSNGDRAR